MPNYDYECTACGHKEEILQKITEEALTTCSQCHQPWFKRKIGQGIGLQFKGTGFYITDYNKPKLSNTSSSNADCKCNKPACSKN